MRRALRCMIPALAALLIGTAQAVTTTNLLVNFEGSLAGTTYTLGAGEIDTTSTFSASGAPALTNMSSEVHADLNGGSDGFYIDPSSLGDLTATNWVAEAVVAFKSFSGGQLTVIDVQGDLSYRLNSGGSGLEAGYWDGATWGSVGSSLPLALNFVHMAVVWDGAASSMTAYTNGVSIGIVDNNAFATPDASNLSFGFFGRNGFDNRGIDAFMHAVSFATSDSAITPADFLINSLPPNPTIPAAPPEWQVNPITGDAGFVGAAYSNTLAGLAVDPNGDPITYAKDSGPAWLVVATNGVLSGTPAIGDVGTNTFVVSAADGVSGSSTSVLNIVVFDLTAADNVLIDNTTRNGSFENETGKFRFIDGDVSFWTNWTEVATASDDTGSEDANLANTYVGLDGARMAYLQPGGAILNMTDYVIKEGDVIDYRFWNARVHDKAATIALVYDDAGTNVTIPGTDVEAATGGTLAAGQITVQAGDAWIGKTIGVGISTSSSWPEIDQVYLGVTSKPADPVTDLVITGPVSGGTQVILTWTGEDGGSYAVQTNSNLIVADWQDLQTGISGTGGTLTVTNTVGPEQTFYRVITE